MGYSWDRGRAKRSRERVKEKGAEERLNFVPVNHAVWGTQPEEREEVWEGQVGERGQRKRRKIQKENKSL